MKTVYNDIIPFKGFKAVNLFGVLFVRKGVTMTGEDFNHEAIHTAQMKELCYVFFYVWYLTEWLIRLCLTRSAKRAYRHIGFEREAFINSGFADYLAGRETCAWFDYI